MNNIKCWLIAMILTSSMQLAYGQGNSYIATDSTIKVGTIIIEGTERNNAQFIRILKDDQEIQYSAEQLTEYGFSNGTVYVSKNISIDGESKQVFLERLEEGKIDLFYYTENDFKTYFLQQDSTVFIEIRKNNDFRKILSEYTNDFDWQGEQVKLVNYNRKSLAKLISFYNNGSNNRLPFPRFGVIAGFNLTSLTIPASMFEIQPSTFAGQTSSNIPPNMTAKKLEGISFSPRSTLTFGVFGDLPIEMSNLSINTGVNFSKSEFAANSRKNRQSEVDIMIDISSINLPFLLRYTIPTFDWRPFINAGVVYSYHLKNEIQVYETSNDQNITTNNEALQESLLSENMLGYTFGLGLQHYLSYRRITTLEFRFNKLYGKENSLNKSHFEILTSFSF